MLIFRLKTVLAILFVTLSSSLCADIIKNGSFESGNPGQTPNDWFFGTHGGADCTMAVTDTTAHSGEKSLKIVNKSIHKAHVYGSLIQNPKLVPGRKYELSCFVKGKDVNELIFILGQRWNQRKMIEPITKDWTRFAFTFTPEKADCGRDGSYMIRLNSDSVTGEAYIDDIEIRPFDVISPVDFQKRRVYLLKRFDKNLNTLKSIPEDQDAFSIPLSPKFYKGKYNSKDSLSSRMSWAWDDKGLIFLADVTDDTVKSFSGSNMWMGDSIQLRIDQVGSMTKGDKATDLEIGFAPDPDGTIRSWCWQFARPLNAEELELYGGITPHGYRVAARLSWKLLSNIDFDAKQNFSLNVIINECDREGMRDVAFLAPGIHTEKSGEHNMLMMFDMEVPRIEPADSIKRSTSSADGRLIVHGFDVIEPWNINAELLDAAGKKHNFILPGIYPLKKDQLAEIDYSFPLQNVAEGEFTLNFAVDEKTTCSQKGRKGDIVKSVAKSLGKISKELDLLSGQIMTHPEISSLYLTAPLEELKRQTVIVKSDMAKCKDKETTNFYANRSENICREIFEGIELLKDRLKQALRKGKKETSWSYVTSQTVMKKGWMYSEAIDQNGKKELRPVLFAGYGHFETAAKDIPYFQKIGANVVQLEIGPYHVLSGYDKKGNVTKTDKSRLNTKILNPLKNAWENNVKLCILLSPHYFPGNILNMYPEMKQNSGMFKYDVNHPAAKRIIRTYLETVIPLIKNSPYRDAVHSICLSNEAAYKGAALKHPYSQKLFIAWMKKKYSTLDKFNSVSGNNFKSYEEMIKSAYRNPAVKFEFSTFKRETFTEWHAWMADIIHEIWPEVPLHAKIMVFDSLSGASLESATDPELFAELSDINGNDNYCLYRIGRGVSNWEMNAIYHDLQRSMKKTMIANTENHVIKDGEVCHIPYGHIYTATFQQFMFGVGTVITWVWHDVDYNLYKKLDALRGNIFRRPIDVIAQSDATLDGNRLAKEIISFCDADPEVYIIFSPTSYIHDTDKYSQDVHNLYEHLSYCGKKIGFISEKQLEAGKAKKAKIIFAPSVKYIRKAAFEKLNEFVKNGGMLITVGESLKYNRFGKPLALKIRAINLPDNLSGSNYVKFLRQIIHRVCRPKVELTFNGKSDTCGFLWRSAGTPRGYLINVVNYTRSSGTISFGSEKGIKAVDLISGRDISAGIKINPLTPMLIKVEKNGN